MTVIACAVFFCFGVSLPFACSLLMFGGWTFKDILLWVLPHRPIGTDYMTRFYLSPIISGYQLRLHHIMRSDSDRDPHDHPYDFWSLILWGGYREARFFVDRIKDAPASTLWHAGTKFRRFGSLAFRRAEHLHILKMKKPTWTLVLAGPDKREWGFWTKAGWVHHSRYFNAANETNSD